MPTPQPESPPTTPLRVGLTGGIASGKSTVAELLRDRGFMVTDADQLVAELYRPGEAGAIAVEQLFGPGYLDSKGGVDHHALAERVFEDSDARRQLEAVIHPLVGRRFTERAAKESVAVFEATLLVDTGGYRGFDLLVTVEAEPELRITRAIERGLSEEAARARMAAQASRDQRAAVADFVIDNDGTIEQLEQQVARLAAELEARRSKRPA